MDLCFFGLYIFLICIFRVDKKLVSRIGSTLHAFITGFGSLLFILELIDTQMYEYIMNMSPYYMLTDYLFVDRGLNIMSLHHLISGISVFNFLEDYKYFLARGFLAEIPVILLNYLWYCKRYNKKTYQWIKYLFLCLYFVFRVINYTELIYQILLLPNPQKLGWIIIFGKISGVCLYIVNIYWFYKLYMIAQVQEHKKK